MLILVRLICLYIGNITIGNYTILRENMKTPSEEYF
jgi:hypothetical protein